jgi:hypothetical protein
VDSFPSRIGASVAYSLAVDPRGNRSCLAAWAKGVLGGSEAGRLSRKIAVEFSLQEHKGLQRIHQERIHISRDSVHRASFQELSGRFG